MKSPQSVEKVSVSLIPDSSPSNTEIIVALLFGLTLRYQNGFVRMNCAQIDAKWSRSIACQNQNDLSKFKTGRIYQCCNSNINATLVIALDLMIL